jgi:splicing factor 3B subunit 2
MDTPESLDLRKGRADGTGDSTPSEAGEPKQLYQILEAKQTDSARGQFMGSTHTYDTGTLAVPEAPPKVDPKDRLGLAKKGNQDIDLALDPSELEGLDEEQLKAKYDAQRAANMEANKGEDYSDIMAEGERKRKAQAQGREDKRKQGRKENFKF